MPQTQLTPRTLEIITEVTGFQFTLEQRMEVLKRVGQEYGGTEPYVAKRLPASFVSSFMASTKGMSVREQVKIARDVCGVHRATAYRWVTRG